MCRREPQNIPLRKTHIWKKLNEIQSFVFCVCERKESAENCRICEFCETTELCGRFWHSFNDAFMLISGEGRKNLVFAEIVRNVCVVCG
jgi:hypothetical protein